MPQSNLLEFDASTISSIKMKVAFSVDDCARNPNCSFIHVCWLLSDG
jgi:hypothetical protein